MRALLAVAVLAVSARVVACADRNVTSPSAPSSPSASALAPASPVPAEPTRTHEPIGALPDDCEPGPDPVSVSDHVGEGIGGDPAWAIGFGGPEATLSFNLDDPYHDHGWLRKVLWLLRRTAADPVTVTGTRLDDASRLWFDYGDPGTQETTLVLDPAAPDGQQGDWFEYRGYFVVPAAGCYHLTAAWPGSGLELDFRAGLDPSQS
jgi:hypothetical protein